MAGAPFSIAPERVPVEPDDDGVLRVGGTRITLDTVVESFEDGCTPEEIAQRYSSLALGDIYATIGYYLRHRDQFDAYLEKRRAEETDARREIEAHPAAQELRQRLLARRKAKRAG